MGRLLSPLSSSLGHPPRPRTKERKNESSYICTHKHQRLGVWCNHKYYLALNGHFSDDDDDCDEIMTSHIIIHKTWQPLASRTTHYFPYHPFSHQIWSEEGPLSFREKAPARLTFPFFLELSLRLTTDQTKHAADNTFFALWPAAASSQSDKCRRSVGLHFCTGHLQPSAIESNEFDCKGETDRICMGRSHRCGCAASRRLTRRPRQFTASDTHVRTDILPNLEARQKRNEWDDIIVDLWCYSFGEKETKEKGKEIDEPNDRTWSIWKHPITNTGSISV